MNRISTYMSIKVGLEEQYKEEHRHIWPEMLELIKRAGVRNYSIFMRGQELYSYFEVKDSDKLMAAAETDPVNERWQAHMAHFFEVGPGVGAGGPVTLEEVFHTQGLEPMTPARQRVATLMQLKPGKEAAYKEAHRHVWPEVIESGQRAGVGSFTIFMRGRTLFSFFDVADLDKAMMLLAADPDSQRWQEHMAHMFDVGPGIAEGTAVYLEEVFRVE